MENFRVKKTVFLAAIAFACASGAAQAEGDSDALSARNYEFAFTSKAVDTSGSPSTGALGAYVDANIPIWGFLGGSLSGAYTHSEVKVRRLLEETSGETATGKESQSCAFSDTDLGASLFVRDPSLGRVGLSYGRGKYSSNCGDRSLFLPSNDDSMTTKSLRAFGEFYWRDLTLAADHTETSFEHGEKLKSNTATLSWYAFDNFRVAVTGNDLYSKNEYGILLVNQPEFLGNDFSVSLGYSIRNVKPEVRTVSFNLIYHFGTSVNLIDRDRKYR